MLHWNREAGGGRRGGGACARGTYQSKLMIVRSAGWGKINCRFRKGVGLNVTGAILDARDSGRSHGVPDRRGVRLREN